MYPTLAGLAGADTSKAKPLDGVNVWETIARGRLSPRTEIVYNIEPFRGAVREGDWKLVWRTPLPSALELFNLSFDRSETNNVATANPGIVARLQKRIEELAGQSTKPLFLVDQFQAMQRGMKGVPVLPTEESYYRGDEP